MKEALFKIVEENAAAAICDNIFSKVIHSIGIFWGCIRFILLHRIDATIEDPYELYHMSEGIPQNLKGFCNYYIVAMELFDPIREIIEEILASDIYEFCIQIYMDPLKAMKDKVEESINKYELEFFTRRINKLFRACQQFHLTGSFPELHEEEEEEEIWVNETETCETPS